MTGLSRRVGLLALIAASVCSASYHFIHFTSRSAPWRGIPEKFDVNALPAKTLTYFITDQSGVQLSPNDTYAGFISQVQAAAKVWNDVETSDLRLAFGGFAAPNSPQSAPSMDIVFEELAPGLIAAGTPTVRAENNGDFIPVLRSVVMLSPDLRNHPTFGESMFGTLVHEVGHALGLQHTFTSGVMSTAVTRTTSRAKPLTPDDIAAISLLYPARDFLQTSGSISGRVTFQGGAGVSLASVVAISPSGAAVSTLTNPDGTYRIDGIPPRSYFVYVHPLPPRRQGQATPGDIVFPVDPDRREYPPSEPFFTVFYPGTNDPSRAIPVSPAAGQVVENVNFAVTPRSGYGIHSVDTRAFPGRVAVKPPYLSPNMTYPFIVATGSGLVNGNAPAAGLTVSVLGGATLTTKPYSPAPASYIQIDFDVRTLSFINDSARHLVFAQGGDIYVLPAAFFHVEKAPPSISSVIAVGDNPAERTAIISGSNLGASSRVFFDGLSIPVREFDAASGRLFVSPPPAAPNHRAAVVVLNPDGQSSLFLEGDTPSAYTYFGEPSTLASLSPTVAITPNNLAAGVETVVQIDVTGGTVMPGQTTIGFGSSDIVVRNITVVSPTRVLANVWLSPEARSGYAQLSVVSGLQLIAQPFAFQVLPASRTFSLKSDIRNAANPTGGISPRAQVLVTAQNPPATLNGSNFVLYLNDQPIPTLGVADNQIRFEVPGTTALGAAVLRLEVAGEKSLPILMVVEPPPPKILSAQTGDTGAMALTSTMKLHKGDLLTLNVENLAAVGFVPDVAQVEVKLGGVRLRVAQVLEQRSGGHQIITFVPDGVPSGTTVVLSVSIGTRVSDPVSLAVEGS